jgi:Zn-dependent protease with chaperone function
LLDLAGQVILHGCLAALVVEALLRLWRVGNPGERLALRWIALATPLLLPPGCLVLAPSRASETFALSRAVFAGTHWNQIIVGSVGLATIAALLLVGVGALLYLRDALPFLDDRLRGIADRHAPSDHPGVLRLSGLLASLAASGLRTRVTALVLDRDTPVLLCSGVDRPTLVISTGALARLDDAELEAALAHELAHAAHRDPLLGWLLMVVRTVAWFSPAAQIVARQIVQDMEYRADMAVVNRGQAAALSAAIAALSDVPDSETDLLPPRSASTRPRALLAHAERVAVGARCERLFFTPPIVDARLVRFRVALAALGLSSLLFFVV